MNDFRFSARSLKSMNGVHPHLIAVAATALQLSDCDFVVTEGRRTIDRQKYLFESGRSKTMNSAHLTGYAVDCYPIIDGDVIVDRIPPMVTVAKAFRAAAKNMSVPIIWGGDWDNDRDWKDERFFDGAHFQLSKPEYDWHAPIPTTKREEWGDDLAELLNLDDPKMSPVLFLPELQPVSATPPRKRWFW